MWGNTLLQLDFHFYMAMFRIFLSSTIQQTKMSIYKAKYMQRLKATTYILGHVYAKFHQTK
jgi:hypothetical protein